MTNESGPTLSPEKGEPSKFKKWYDANKQKRIEYPMGSKGAP